MNTPNDTLSDRVRELVRSTEKHSPILSTTGTRAAIESLAGRVETLEQAVREIAAAVEELTHAPR